jgi:hypothetical protein
LRDLVNPGEAEGRTNKGDDGNVDPHHPPPM